jgi:hypothetical protein
MDVKEAVKIAKEFIADLFSTEGITNLGLEEVEFDEGSSSWNVTIGFSRPWDKPGPNVLSALAGQLAQQLAEQNLRRSYKIVCIDNITKKVRSVKNMETK